MKATTKRALSLIISGFLLIFSLVIYASLIRPKYSEIQELRGTLASKISLLNEEQSSIDQVSNLIAQYQGAAKLEDSLSLALPQEESLPSLIAQLNTFAAISGLGIQSVDINYLPAKPSPLKLSSAKKVAALRLTMRSAGTYSGIKQFLQNMEKNIRIMDLAELKMEAVKPGQDLFNYSIIIDTYYQIK